MIAFVQGTIDEIGDGYAVIGVNGIGYEVLVSGETAGQLSARGLGEEVKLYTYLNVDREGAMSLLGFLSRDDLRLFRVLITVNGVGPKAGLQLLSAMSADELRFAIVSGDVKTISRAPGIGKKTAERLVLELRDKLEVATKEGLEGNPYAAADSLPGETASQDPEVSDAIEALTALGYQRAEAVRAVHKAKDEAKDGEASTEDLLKAALRELG